MIIASLRRRIGVRNNEDRCNECPKSAASHFSSPLSVGLTNPGFSDADIVFMDNLYSVDKKLIFLDSNG